MKEATSMKRTFTVILSIAILILHLAGCSGGWSAIRLSPTYKIDIEDIDVPSGLNDSIHYTTYLFKQEGVYGDTKRPYYFRLGQLKIWTTHKNKVYMLAKTSQSDNYYFLLDLKSNEMMSSDNLEDFDEKAQEIYVKLNAHPELFTDIQEINASHRSYQLNGKGQVNLDDLD